MHIRRGDYITNPTSSKMHGSCSVDYYISALGLVSECLRELHCFIFSDDPHWVLENMRLSMPTTIVGLDEPNLPHEDLWLMSACQKFIISNSSLSWWGAWLLSASDKKEVAPKKWFATESVDTRDLIPSNWIRI